jgi:hypothetical protein
LETERLKRHIDFQVSGLLWLQADLLCKKGKTLHGLDQCGRGLGSS